MADQTYHPRGAHPRPSGLVERRIFSGVGAPISTYGVPENSIWFDESTGDAFKLVDGAWVEQFPGAGGADEEQLFSGNYAGAVPNITPTASTAIALDTSNGTQWNWYNSTWH